MYPASNSYFMSIDRPTVVLKRFFGNSLSDIVKITANENDVNDISQMLR